MSAADRPSAGRGTILALRVVWTVITVGALVTAVAAFVVVLGERQLDALLGAGILSLNPEMADHLVAIGVTEPVLLGADITFRIAAIATFTFTGALLFLRRSDDGVTVAVSLMLVLVGASWFAPLSVLADADPAWAPAVAWIGVPDAYETYGRSLAGLALLLFLFVFPDGRFVPRWTAAAFAVVVTHAVLWALLPGSFLDVTTWPAISQIAWVAGVPALGLGAQVYRYAYVSRPVGRQQTKLVLIAMGTIAAVIPLLVAVQPELGRAFPELAVVTPRVEALYDLFLVVLLGCAVLLLPVSIAASVLRYRLWDIDVIINRAVVYGALTLVVVVGWFLATVVLSALLTPALGHLRGSNAAVLLSTIAAAIIFQPIRQRLQEWVDRHFFRRKWDAQVYLERFAGRIRVSDEAEVLTDELLDAVDETLEPSHLDLMLRSDDDGSFSLVTTRRD